MRSHPRILRVEGGTLSLLDTETGLSTPLRDVAAGTARWWRRVEQLIRFRIVVAIHAKQAEDQCDIIWAGSEAIGIPLSFLRLHKPLVVTAHHMSSPAVAKFSRATGVVDKWAGIGFVSDESRQFFVNYFGVSPNRLFLCESAKYLGLYDLHASSCDGPIMSTGVAKRDYSTLVAALANLPECSAELFISSKFGDKLKKAVECADTGTSKDYGVGIRRGTDSPLSPYTLRGCSTAGYHAHWRRHHLGSGGERARQSGHCHRHRWYAHLSSRMARQVSLCHPMM